jgi:hypothetical protein
MLLGEFSWGNLYPQLINFKNLAIGVRSVLRKINSNLNKYLSLSEDFSPQRQGLDNPSCQGVVNVFAS